MKLLNAKQVAEILNVSPVTVYRLADTGILPTVEVVKCERKRILRFRPEMVEKFVTNREQRAGR